ncbi:MAG: DMT family transporter [Flammeovirgaceae bacterium]|nr:DMT family transporter [Flammeovirgaceae bacterium]MDW8286764.1 DMT family transporter [Flammeovirgaceae bacterium]
MIKYHLKLHFIVFLWGFTAILGKLITVPSVELVFWRTFFAAVSLFFLMLFIGKKPVRHAKAIASLLLTGCIVAFHWIAFFASVQLSKVSICLAGLSTTTLFTAVLDPIINRKAIKWYEIALGGMAIIGLYTIFQFEFDHALGLSLGLLAAFLAALFSVLNAKHYRQYDSFSITLYEMIGGFFCAALVVPFYHLVLDGKFYFPSFPNLMDTVWILILAIVCTVYAFYQCVKLLEKLSVFYINLTINLEPIYGILLAFLIFKENEQMTTGFYVGTLLILVSVLVYPIIQRMEKARSTAHVASHQ